MFRYLFLILFAFANFAFTNFVYASSYTPFFNFKGELSYDSARVSVSGGNTVSAFTRYFLPPGAQRTSIDYYSQWGSYCDVYYSFGTPPDLKDPISYKHYTLSGSDTLPVFYRVATTYENAGWLYVYHTCSEGSVYLRSFTSSFDLSVFKNWYLTTEWDSSGNPPEGDVVINNCSVDNLGECVSEAQCSAIGKYWYAFSLTVGPSCNFNPPCSVASIDSCDSQSWCEMSNFYWYDSTGGDNATCKLDKPCNSDNLTKCSNKELCGLSDFYWYDPEGGDNESCNTEVPCSSDNIDRCVTESLCSESGFTWNATAQKCEYNKCDSSHKEFCTNESDCSLKAFGYWWSSDGTCRSTAPSSGGSTGGSKGGSSGGSTGGSSGGTVSTCNPFSEALGLCSSSGGSTGGTTPTQNTGCNAFLQMLGKCDAQTPSCSSSDLTKCKDSTSCTNAGAYWTGSECKAYKTLKSLSNPFLNDGYGNSPFKLGTGMESDFEMDDDEKFKWELFFGPYKNNMDVYLAFNIGGDSNLYLINDKKQITTDFVKFGSGSGVLSDKIFDEFTICDVIGKSDLTIYYGVMASGKSLSVVSDEEFEYGYIYLKNNCTTKECLDETPQYCLDIQTCEDAGGFWDESALKCFKKASLDNGSVNQIMTNYGYMTMNSSMTDFKINKGDSLSLSFNFGPFGIPVNLYLAYATSNTLKFINSDGSTSDVIVPFASDIAGQYMANSAYSLSDLCSVFGSETPVFGYILTPSDTPFTWDSLHNAEIGYMVFENVCNAQSVGGDAVNLSESECKLSFFYVWDDATSTCREK